MNKLEFLVSRNAKKNYIPRKGIKIKFRRFCEIAYKIFDEYNRLKHLVVDKRLFEAEFEQILNEIDLHYFIRERIIPQWRGWYFRALPRPGFWFDCTGIDFSDKEYFLDLFDRAEKLNKEIFEKDWSGK